MPGSPAATTSRPTRGLRDRYRSNFAQRRAAARDLAPQRQIPCCPSDTVIDVSAQLRELLGKRR
jgi:hypothetical protein